MGNASMGHAARVGAGAASPATEEYDFLSCGVAKEGSHVPSPAMRGTRSRIDTTVNDGTYRVGGPLVLEPRPDDLDNWLPRILGAVEAADVFALAETVPEFYLIVDKVADVYEYSGCKILRASFRSAAGDNLQMALDTEGKDQTAKGSGNFPDIAASLSVLQPYIHHQAVLKLPSTSVEVDNIEIIIDNVLKLNRFNNSQTRTGLPEGDRIVSLSCDNPFTSDETAYYDMLLAGIDLGTVKYTAGSYSLEFKFGNLKAPARGPEVTGREVEIPLRLEFTAYKKGTDDEVKVTNVSA